MNLSWTKPNNESSNYALSLEYCSIKLFTFVIKDGICVGSIYISAPYYNISNAVYGLEVENLKSLVLSTLK